MAVRCRPCSRGRDRALVHDERAVGGRGEVNILLHGELRAAVPCGGLVEDRAAVADGRGESDSNPGGRLSGEEMIAAVASRSSSRRAIDMPREEAIAARMGRSSTMRMREARPPPRGEENIGDAFPLVAEAEDRDGAIRAQLMISCSR